MTDPRLPDIGAHPLNNMDTESIEAAAASLAALGRVVGQNGAQAVTAWAPISSAYKGPGDAELIAAMAPVSTLSTEVSTRTASAARSLRTLKQTADEIKATMTTLKADLVDLRADVAAFEPTKPTGGRVPHGAVRTDWWDDPALEGENQRIIKGLNDCVERMHEAERVCINEIRALHDLSPLTAGDGSYADGNYGVDEIPHDAETPWGTAEPDNENCAEAAGSWVVNAGKDLAGLVGMQWDSDGDFSWTLDNFTETWTGMAVLITRNPETGEWFDWGAAGDAWLGAGKDFLAWDRWSENPQGAFTDVVLNVGTSFIAGAGAATKIAKVGKLGRRGDVDVDVDVDIDAGDFAVPRIDLDSDLDLDIDFGDLDLDIDVPGDRPDVPVNRPDVPVDRPDVPSDRPDVTGGVALRRVRPRRRRWCERQSLVERLLRERMTAPDRPTPRTVTSTTSPSIPASRSARRTRTSTSRRRPRWTLRSSIARTPWMRAERPLQRGAMPSNGSTSSASRWTPLT